jgi:hypothetical protein
MTSRIQSTETCFGFETSEDYPNCKFLFVLDSESKSVNIKVVNSITSFVEEMNFEDFSKFIKWGDKLVKKAEKVKK